MRTIFFKVVYYEVLIILWLCESEKTFYTQWLKYYYIPALYLGLLGSPLKLRNFKHLQVTSSTLRNGEACLPGNPSIEFKRIFFPDYV